MTDAAGSPAAHGWRLPALLLAAGVAVRVLHLVRAAPHRVADGEIANVAIAFARTGTLADAFRPGQGPTAHVLPLPPIYAGLVYRWLGVRSDAAEAVLATGSILVVVAGFALLYHAFGQLGTPRPARLAALAIACLAPLNLAMETIDFRIWEGGFGVALAIGFLTALHAVERRGVPGTRAVLSLSVAAAAVLFVSPPLGLGAYAGALLLLAGRLPRRRWLGATGIMIAALALFVAPWAIRNAAMLGEPILLRSDVGLELAIGNHAAAAAAAPADELAAFTARLETNPYASDAAYAAMVRAGGEAPYARARGNEALAWAAHDPAGFIGLSLRHLREFYFPPAWEWHRYSAATRASRLKQAAWWTASGLGLAGMTAALIVAPGRYRYAALLMTLTALPYMLTQPILRYSYLVFGLSLFFAADFVARVWQRRTVAAAPGARGELAAPAFAAGRQAPLAGVVRARSR